MRPIFEYEKKHNLCGKIRQLVDELLRNIDRLSSTIPSLNTWAYELKKELKFTLFKVSVVTRLQF